MSQMASAAGLLFLGEILGKDLVLGGREKLGRYLLRMSGFFIFISAVMAVFSAYQWLSANYQSETAALLTATVALGMAVFFTFCGGIVIYLRQRRLKRLRREMMEELQKIFHFIEDEFISAPVQEHPKTAALFASVAGFAVGDRIL